MATWEGIDNRGRRSLAVVKRVAPEGHEEKPSVQENRHDHERHRSVRECSARQKGLGRVALHHPMIRKQLARRSIVPASGQLGIDHGVLDVLAFDPCLTQARSARPLPDG
jgi:hypothetical protein